MEGREDETDCAIAMEVITQLRSKNVDGIIPGCTEIPLLLEENINAPDLLNPVQLLAEAAVKYCLD
jgi:aspartate/glutamate racemase